jgi:SAM-dependent methyltransferase
LQGRVCYARRLPMMTSADPRDRYLEALSSRHLRDLKFSEVTRALRSLSVGYVQKREERGLARALDGRGKRAAFALYYGARHFLAADALIRDFNLGFAGTGRRTTVLDLGCGTGVCGAAWALRSAPKAHVVGADRSSFALHEARWTYGALRIHGDTRRSIAEGLQAVRQPDGVVMGWTLNELDSAHRADIGKALLPWVARGTRLLIVEPVSARVSPWWAEWTAPFEGHGCSAHETKLKITLPPKIALLARSAGLGLDPLVLRVLVSNAPGGGNGSG